MVVQTTPDELARDLKKRDFVRGNYVLVLNNATTVRGFKTDIPSPSGDGNEAMLKILEKELPKTYVTVRFPRTGVSGV